MNLKHAFKDPAGEFESPEAVLDDERLSHEQKKAILEQWRHDARLLEEATAENMGGGEPALLHRVTDALARLGD